jgi:hypothetical protein
VAVLNFYSDAETWPAETGPGAIPPGLAAYLPGSLFTTFELPDYTLDYDNLTVLDSDDPVIAVSVRSSDARLMAKFVATYATKSPFFMNGDKLSYLIAGPGGVF